MTPVEDLRVRYPTTCPECGGPKQLHRQYDTYYCARCNVWLSTVCGAAGCLACKDRPERPLQTKE